MQYRDTTFSLYADLFDQVHTQLIKEAQGNVVGRGLDWMRRLATRPKTVQKLERGLATETAVTKAQAQRIAELEAAAAKAPATTAAAPGAQRGRNMALGAMGLTAAAGLPGAYFLGQDRGEENKKLTRNLAFGAGAAAGLSAPHLVRGLSHVAQSAGRSGLLPELQGYGGIGYPGGSY